MKDLNIIENNPVSHVQWIDASLVSANDYNPNKVAPPEMALLQLSIESDGYTQPIVAWQKEDGTYEVIDGFHRHLVGKKLGLSKLPLVVINKDREDKCDRISSTIRHNRARGKHIVSAMSDIVIELKKRNWSNDRISKELGMDNDEVLRLCQISGLKEVFSDDQFSKAWDVEIFKSDEIDTINEEDIKAIKEDDTRILHTFDKWECYPAGFYEDNPPSGMTAEECEIKYRDFLSDTEDFSLVLQSVIDNWIRSCEHYLSNENMNRIAWLGQASLCYKYRIPSRFRGGHNLLTDEQKKKADTTALKYLNKWLKKYNRPEITMEDAASKTENNLY